MSAKFPALIILLLISAAANANAIPAKEINWHRSYDAGMKAARESGKPVLIDFVADWCGPCKRMEAEFWPQAKVVAAAEKFVCITVDIDRETGVAARFRANPIPLVVIADPWSNQIYRHTGYRQTEGLLNVMKAMPGDYSEVIEWGDLLKKDGKSARALVGIADFYRKHQIVDLSADYYKRALKTKEVETDAEMREDVLLKLGVAHLKMKNFGEAQKIFERCSKELPDSARADQALLGVLFAQVGQKKLAEAESTLAQLRSKFPDSLSARKGAEQLTLAKNQKTN